MATALAAVTSRIRWRIAIRPGFIAAGLLAQMVATLDQISRGRVDLNRVPGGIQGHWTLRARQVYRPASRDGRAQAAHKESGMEDRRLGASGLQVSVMGLGTNTFGPRLAYPTAERV